MSPRLCLQSSDLLAPGWKNLFAPDRWSGQLRGAAEGCDVPGLWQDLNLTLCDRYLPVELADFLFSGLELGL
jgi:hypothetical protein